MKILKKWKFRKMEILKQFWKYENFGKVKMLKKWKFWKKFKILEKWVFWKNLMLYVLIKEICKIYSPFNTHHFKQPR